MRFSRPCHFARFFSSANIIPTFAPYLSLQDRKRFAPPVPPAAQSEENNYLFLVTAITPVYKTKRPRKMSGQPDARNMPDALPAGPPRPAAPAAHVGLRAKNWALNNKQMMLGWSGTLRSVRVPILPAILPGIIRELSTQNGEGEKSSKTALDVTPYLIKGQIPNLRQNGHPHTT